LGIFQKDLYEDKNRLSLFQELVGLEGHKPFECVGTNEEVLWSMWKSVEKIRTENKPLPFILQTLAPRIIDIYPKAHWVQLQEKLFSIMPHHLPAELCTANFLPKNI
jgi:hypothetical protein